MEERTCFVLMPFAADLEEVYRHAIKPAAEAAGFVCSRADDADAPRNIVRGIVEAIFGATVLIADLSRFNPNVLYELGVAHTAGRPVVLVCEKTAARLPFDLKSYRTIFYTRTVDGIREALYSSLKRLFETFDSWSVLSANPVLDFRPVRYAVPLEEQADLEARLAGRDKEILALKDRIALLESEQMTMLEVSYLLSKLSDIEVKHLRGLAAPEPFHYIKRSVFLDELRHLRGFGLIRNSEVGLGQIPDEGDLKAYVELTDKGLEFFARAKGLVTPRL